MTLPQTDTVLRYSTRPMLVMQGNSDPFDCLAIRVTPDINRIITFARTAYLPGMRGGDIDALKFDLSFCHRDMIAARFSSYGFCLARLLPEVTRSEFEQVCLRINDQALNSLRNLFARPQPWSDSHTLHVIEHIAYMILSDCEARRLDDASFHLSILTHLAERLAITPIYSKSIFQTLITAMHGTLESSCLNLRSVDSRCLEWLEVKFGRLGLFVDLVLPSVIERHQVYDMHASIRTPFHWSAFRRARELQYIVSLDPAQGMPSMNFSAMMVYAHQKLHQPLTLLNHYLKLRDDLTHSKHGSPASDYQMALEPLLSLTLLCYMRQTILSARIPGTNIELRDASQSLAPELMQAVITCIEIFAAAPGRDAREHHEVVFWALFRGAVYEQNHSLYAIQQRQESNSSSRDTPTTSTSRLWFCKNLSKQARLLGVEDWPSAESILSSFVPSSSEATAKQGHAAWFQQILGATKVAEG